MAVLGNFSGQKKKPIENTLCIRILGAEGD